MTIIQFLKGLATNFALPLAQRWYIRQPNLEGDLRGCDAAAVVAYLMLAAVPNSAAGRLFTVSDLLKHALMCCSHFVP